MKQPIAQGDNARRAQVLKEIRPDLAGRIAFVTGAATGIGRDFAYAAAECGAAVAVTDLDAAAAERVAQTIIDAGGEAFACRCDVTDDDEVAAAVAAVIERFGGIDILVNNAGLHLTRYNRRLIELGAADLRRLFDVNVLAVVGCTLACRATMAARGGGIVINLSSTAAYSANSAYGASKLAVRGLTTTLATELALDGIRVNAVAPGLIASETAVQDVPVEIFDLYSNELQIIRRRGTVGDVTALMMFLCSDAANFITGETIRTSGGFPLTI